MVQMPSLASATATPLRRLRDQLEDTQHARIQARRPARRARRAAARASASSSVVFARRAPSCPPRPSSDRRPAPTRRVLTPAVSSSASTISSRIVIFELLDLGLGERDLVLNRVIFLVGLHRHRLLAELRQAPLVHAPRPSRCRGGRPGSRRALLGGGHLLARGFEPRVERLQPLGLVGQPPFGVVCGGVELLQRDQPFEIMRSCRRSRAQKKPRRLRTGAWRATRFASRRAVGVRIGCQSRACRAVRMSSSRMLAIELQRNDEVVGPPGFEPGTGRL